MMQKVDIEAIVAATEAKEAQRAIDMPDVETAIRAMWAGYQRLRELGWREAMYCPKDGSAFEVIEPGSVGIHYCTYSGEWPTGSWWVESAGDIWPSHPILFRPIAATTKENHANQN
jgi:hypothetical protein